MLFPFPRLLQKIVKRVILCYHPFYPHHSRRLLKPIQLLRHLQPSELTHPDHPRSPSNLTSPCLFAPSAPSRDLSPPPSRSSLSSAQTTSSHAPSHTPTKDVPCSFHPRKDRYPRLKRDATLIRPRFPPLQYHQVRRVPSTSRRSYARLRSRCRLIRSRNGPAPPHSCVGLAHRRDRHLSSLIIHPPHLLRDSARRGRIRTFSG